MKRGRGRRQGETVMITRGNGGWGWWGEATCASAPTLAAHMAMRETLGAMARRAQRDATARASTMF